MTSTFTFTFHSLSILVLYMHRCIHPLLEKAMAAHSSVLAWGIPGTGNLVGCRLWGGTESDMTEVT